MLESTQKQNTGGGSQSVLASSAPVRTHDLRNIQLNGEIDVLACLLRKRPWRETSGLDVAGRRPGATKQDGPYVKEDLGHLKSRLEPIDRGKMQHQIPHLNVGNSVEERMRASTKYHDVGRADWSAGPTLNEKIQPCDLETISSLVHRVQELVEVINRHRNLRMAWWEQYAHRGRFWQCLGGQDVMVADMQVKMKTGMKDTQGESEYNLHILEAAGIPCGAVYCAVDVNDERWQCFPSLKWQSSVGLFKGEVAPSNTGRQPLEVAASPKLQTESASLSGHDGSVKVCAGMKNRSEGRDGCKSKCGLGVVEDLLPVDVDAAWNTKAMSVPEVQGGWLASSGRIPGLNLDGEHCIKCRIRSHPSEVPQLIRFPLV